jgi:uncharacterized protein YbcC (UPF0753/DUF2309 family)
MFARMEMTPAEAPRDVPVRLIDYVAVHTVLTDASLRAAAAAFGGAGSDEAAHRWLTRLPSLDRVRRRAAHDERLRDLTRLCERCGVHDVDALTDAELRAAARFMAVMGSLARRALWLEALERTNLRQVVAGIDATAGAPVPAGRPALQLFTCIDDREESLRRYIEAEEPRAMTFGVPGFFGLPVVYHAADGREPMTLCPLGVTPRHTVEEHAHGDEHGRLSAWLERRRIGAIVTRAVASASRGPVTAIAACLVLLPLVAVRLLLETLAPGVFNHLRRLFFDAVLEPARTQLVAPHGADEAAKLLAVTFDDIGQTRDFAPLVVVLGHGSRSLNNPYFAAYDCGACSGRHGGPNARLFAQLANDRDVRAVLARDHAIHIPPDTHFVGGLHNTSNDSVTLIDRELAPSTHAAALTRADEVFTRACANNALERCRRFLLADVTDTDTALKHVRLRAEDPSEVRPELNHATNAFTIVGRRLLTRSLFLDRRAFLCDYDPLHDDERGTHLERVIAPGLIVCSGINLEYYFSATDRELMGAGSKAPLNIVGHIGVLQGAYGDLRPGLPTQMTEMHTPVRSLFVVDAPLARVQAVLSRRPELDRLVHNGWVNMVTRDPTSGAYFVHGKNGFTALEERAVELPHPKQLAPWIASSASDLSVAFLPSKEVA